MVEKGLQSMKTTPVSHQRDLFRTDALQDQLMNLFISVGMFDLMPLCLCQFFNRTLLLISDNVPHD